MIPSRLISLICTCVLLAGSAWAAPAPESNQKKIVGVWEIVKSDDGTPPGTTLEFMKDGKLKIKIRVGQRDLAIEGSYKVESDKLTYTVKDPEGKEKEVTETVTITKLTDKELMLKDKKGQVDEMKKKK